MDFMKFKNFTRNFKEVRKTGVTLKVFISKHLFFNVVFFLPKVGQTLL